MKERCKETVYPKDRWGAFHGYGCQRYAVKDGYCKQHHPDSVKKRQDAAKQRFQDKQKSSCWYQLTEARKEIERLRAEIERLTGGRDV